MISIITELEIESIKSNAVLAMKEVCTNTCRIKILCFLIRVGIINSADQLNQFIQQNLGVFKLAPYEYFTDLILEWSNYNRFDYKIDERYGASTIEERQQLMSWYKKV